MTDTAIAWDIYARQRPERRPVNSRGETTWFNWTQYEDHGPGAELLGLPPVGASWTWGAKRAATRSTSPRSVCTPLAWTCPPRSCARPANAGARCRGWSCTTQRPSSTCKAAGSRSTRPTRCTGPSGSPTLACCCPSCVSGCARAAGVLPAAAGRGLLRLPSLVHPARRRRGPPRSEAVGLRAGGVGAATHGARLRGCTGHRAQCASWTARGRHPDR